jgi:hypothetical protein
VGKGGVLSFISAFFHALQYKEPLQKTRFSSIGGADHKKELLMKKSRRINIF